MTEKINSIFCHNVELLSSSSKAVSYIRRQNFYTALSHSAKAIDKINEVLTDLQSEQDYFNSYADIVEFRNINQMLEELLEAQRAEDYILLADLYELKLNPFILNLQEIILNQKKVVFDEEQYKANIRLIRQKDKKLGELLEKAEIPPGFLNRKYIVEYTSQGLFTLAIESEGNKYYFHSNGLVSKESWSLAREWLLEGKEEYFIYGLGLGYHVRELMELDDSIEIHVYESDLKVIQLACTFGCINTLLQSGRVEVIYDPDFLKLSAAKIGEEACYVIHYPSIRNIGNIKIREQMEDYFVSYSSVMNQRHCLKGNLRRNIGRCDAYIDELREQFFNKDLFIVASGPSLDKNYMQLKNLNKNAIILSTGTVLKKLLKAGIRPDYVIIIDGNEGVYRQIEGIEEVDIPLLFLSTVYHKITEYYKGKKYLICQEKFEKAVEFANEKGYNLYQSGGSVSTIALDIGIQFKCRRIIYLGLDLAYTNSYNHASDTAAFDKVDLSNPRQVKDIYGKMINTGKNLDIYRKWIERRINAADAAGIEFINATEGGAYIEGMKVKKMIQCTEESNP